MSVTRALFVDGRLGHGWFLCLHILLVLIGYFFVHWIVNFTSSWIFPNCLCNWDWQFYILLCLHILLYWLYVWASFHILVCFTCLMAFKKAKHIFLLWVHIYSKSHHAHEVSWLIKPYCLVANVEKSVLISWLSWSIVVQGRECAPDTVFLKNALNYESPHYKWNHSMLVFYSRWLWILCLVPMPFLPP